jgi:phosphoribosylaminoimidazole-succinocarboxamide synthase
MKAQSRARWSVHFKDDATAFNAQKHATIDGKGVLNNRLSEFIFNG